jgi:maltose-binding protein MalE
MTSEREARARVEAGEPQRSVAHSYNVSQATKEQAIAISTTWELESADATALKTELGYEPSPAANNDSGKPTSPQIGSVLIGSVLI